MESRALGGAKARWDSIVLVGVDVSLQVERTISQKKLTAVLVQLRVQLMLVRERK